jgi:hypothetical protein
LQGTVLPRMYTRIDTTTTSVTDLERGIRRK